MLERSILTPEEVRVLLRGIPEDEPRLEPTREMRGKRAGIPHTRPDPAEPSRLGESAAKAAWRLLFPGSSA